MSASNSASDSEATILIWKFVIISHNAWIKYIKSFEVTNNQFANKSKLNHVYTAKSASNSASDS